MVDVRMKRRNADDLDVSLARIVDPANPKTKWVFKTPQSDALMADAIAIHEGERREDALLRLRRRIRRWLARRDRNS
jgi:hypothetical protein